MALHPSRIDDYFKGCNAAQIVAGGLVTGATAPFAVLALHDLGTVAAASNLATLVGAGSAAASATATATTAAGFGLYILRDAC